MVDWKGKHVLILGAARQGLAAARWLTRHGAIVTLNDRNSPEKLVNARKELIDLPITWVIGSHPLEILEGKDFLCISGGISLDNPLVLEARRRNLPLSNDTQMFLEAVPCFTIGITGSAGKTTTTTMVGDMAKIPMGKRAFIGGNIGDPLLNCIDEMTVDDIAIMEISSFQLEQMTLSTNVAAILNITPNHLDRHGTMEVYTAAKKRILDFQDEKDTAVLCRDDPGSWAMRDYVQGNLSSFGFTPLPHDMDGTYLKDGILYLKKGSNEVALMPSVDINLRGDHNIMNTLAAFAIGSAGGLVPDDMVKAVKAFKGVAHRLEFIREWYGSRWYNDTIASTPERAMAAIQSFHEPIILLLGGRDKNLPWDRLADLIRQRVDHVVLFGEAAGKIQAALAEKSGSYSIAMCEGLKEAVDVASGLAKAGDVILLSPGGTSFDQFKDFEERGEAFRKWVSELS